MLLRARPLALTVATAVALLAAAPAAAQPIGDAVTRRFTWAGCDRIGVVVLSCHTIRYDFHAARLPSDPTAYEFGYDGIGWSDFFGPFAGSVDRPRGGSPFGTPPLAYGGWSPGPATLQTGSIGYWYAMLPGDLGRISVDRWNDLPNWIAPSFDVAVVYGPDGAPSPFAQPYPETLPDGYTRRFVTVTVTPEPTTTATLGLGLLGLAAGAIGLRGRRRRR